MRQVRTRPTFSVVTRPASSSTPTCFFMPVRVMSNVSARSVIEASAARELVEDAAPGGVGEGGERGVEVGRMILNHVVQYTTDSFKQVARSVRHGFCLDTPQSWCDVLGL